ncbi:MAG TPA: TolC family protein [Bryobacterales bacterium]|nr:TolC family protein [Bryobacterales bacterium]
MSRPAIPIQLLLLGIAPLACLAQAQPVGDGGPVRLSLKRAVEIALSPEGSARIQLSEEALRQARLRSAEARAALLPDIEGSVTEENLNRNLAAFGLQLSAPLPGFQIPAVVGPFNVFDARATASQSLFDFSSIRRFQASKVAVNAAKADRQNADNEVSAQVAKAYYAALRSEAALEAANADVALAEALVKQAQDQKTAGTGTGIEITRARVQLANARQRQLAAENDRRRAHLQLLRAMNVRLDIAIELTDKLAYLPADPIAVQEATQQALNMRADWKAQQQREENARLASSAVKMERLPSLTAFADYGSIGTGIDNAFPTRTYGVSLRVPVFDGGRRDARRAESQSQWRQERVRTSDLREQIALDVRLALDSLRSAEDQVKVAEEGLALAENELEQARRRYAAGVANGIEVTDAQTRLERARENRIAALYSYNLARIDLAQATGTIRSLVQ